MDEQNCGQCIYHSCIVPECNDDKYLLALKTTIKLSKVKQKANKNCEKLTS